jgi:hypothetical protein
MVKSLTSDGIVLTDTNALYGAEEAGLVHRANEEIRSLVQQHNHDGVRGKQKSSPGKTYLVSLLSNDIDFQSPFLRLALHRHLLKVVNGYLGLRSCLRAINVWLNLPDDGPPKESQLWHRDGDDLQIVKVFIYFTNVDMESGPFWFIPGTHRGKGRKIAVPMEQGRVSDAQMREAIDSAKWKACLGRAGTVILADTTGFHKGGRCEKDSRLLLTFEYVSAASQYPREFSLRGSQGEVLDGVQRDALFG